MTSINASLESALRLNNEAVSLLVAGQDRKALTKLQQAVGMVKRNIARHLYTRSSSSSSSSSSLMLTSKAASQQLQQVLPTLTLEQLHHDSVQLSGLGNLQCYVYNRAFRVSSVEQLLPSRSNGRNSSNAVIPSIEKAAQTGSAIIIFNMALALHRTCLLQNRTISAAKALALYKVVLKLLKASSSSMSMSSPSSSASATLQGVASAIQLAALNNMAQLQFEEGHYAEATRGFGSLAHLMTTIQRAPLGATEMRGIVINILHLQKGAKFAPAA